MSTPDIGAAPLPLHELAILSCLRDRGVRTPSLRVLASVDSTNRYCLEHVGTLASGAVCVAEAQTRGRGREGRHWIATPNKNIMLSLAWVFARTSPLAGLSLAAGLATLQALERHGVRDAGLKWPNDILWKGRKLAGLLIDTCAHSAGQTMAVIGVGINVDIAPEDGLEIDQPWIDLAQMGLRPDRNSLVASVIERLRRVCERYAVEGFDGVRDEWEQRHVYQGQWVELQGASSREQAWVLGVNGDGALRVRNSTGVERLYYSGDISLRNAVVST